VTLGLVGLVATAVPAGATGAVKKVLGVGSITCSYGTTMSFSPPLRPGLGTQVAKNVDELITVATGSIGSCTGAVTAGWVPTSGTPTKAIVFKEKPFPFNRTYYDGGCNSFGTVQLRIKAMSVDWTAASGVLKPTKAYPGYATLGSDGEQNLGFGFSGSARGSFAGAAGLGLYFTGSSSSALQACIGGSGTVSTLNVDPTQSSISLG
jgi:hypothetical protein